MPGHAILLTGATDGIGRAAALQPARAGERVSQPSQPSPLAQDERVRREFWDLCAPLSGLGEQEGT